LAGIVPAFGVWVNTHLGKAHVHALRRRLNLSLRHFRRIARFTLQPDKLLELGVFQADCEAPSGSWRAAEAGFVRNL
jgi:hypothetical protein